MRPRSTIPFSVVRPSAQEGSTPLHFAAQSGHVKVAKALLAVGADKEAKGGVRVALTAHLKQQHFLLCVRQPVGEIGALWPKRCSTATCCELNLHGQSVRMRTPPGCILKLTRSCPLLRSSDALRSTWRQYTATQRWQRCCWRRARTRKRMTMCAAASIPALSQRQHQRVLVCAPPSF